MHPDYQKVFSKQNVSPLQSEEVMRRFSNNGLPNARIHVDALGRLQLSGSYENEREVELAFSIARGVVGESSVSNVRPELIKQKDWEISASEGFAKFIEELAKKFNMSVHVEQSEANNLVGVSDTGLDGTTQFDSNSSELTPNAKQFYIQMAIEIARSPSEKDQKKRILIVGHTDDLGDSRHNAVLSERRARSVGKVFESASIASDRIYFQGAGESLPIGDNRTVEGRNRNRRVEIADIDSNETFSEYLRSRNLNIEYYRPRLAEVQINRNKSSSVHEIPNKVAPMKSASTKQNELKPSIMDIDYGGMLAGKDSNIEILASFGELVEKRPSLFTKVSSFFVNEAQANSEKIYNVSCLKDSPRYSGDVVSLKTGEKLEYKTRDYIPGLDETSWADAVNGHLVALTHVGVLRDGATPTNNPELFVYINNTQPERDAKADVRGEPIVNVYMGTKGLLYRLFSRDKSNNWVCSDLVFPYVYTPPFEAKNGKLFYRKGDAVYSAEFKPKMVQ